MNRVVTIAIITLWLSSVAALVAHDLWPRWTAYDPPKADPIARDVQVGIFDAAGRRIGAGWTSVKPTMDVQADDDVKRDVVTINSTTAIETRWVAQRIRIRVESTVQYQDGRLDEFMAYVYGAPFSITLRGENMGAGFPCELVAGPIRRTFAFDAEQMQALGDAMRPFDILPDLTVGRTWRIRLFNPIKQILGQKADFEMLLVTVVGKETIDHRGQPVECFRVEARDIVAFVDATGRVLEQRVTVPIVGTLAVRDEPFDSKARQAARQRIPSF